MLTGAGLPRRTLIKHHKHVTLVERRLGCALLAPDEARVAEIRDADLQRLAALPAGDVEESFKIGGRYYFNQRRNLPAGIASVQEIAERQSFISTPAAVSRIARPSRAAVWPAS